MRGADSYLDKGSSWRSGKEPTYAGDSSSIPGSRTSPAPRRKCTSTLVCLPGESPRTEEPGRLLSMGSQRVGHDLMTKQQQHK